MLKRNNISFKFYMIYLGTSCNRTDDDNVSIIGPHFEEYPSGTGKNNYLQLFKVNQFLVDYDRF